LQRFKTNIKMSVLYKQTLLYKNKPKNLIFTLFIGIFLLFLAACGKKTASPVNTGTGKILATAYQENLYFNDIKGLVAENMTPEDSAKAINGAVQKWLRDRVMLHTVADKVRSTPEIDALVEDYRNSLLLQRYRSELSTNEPQNVDTTIAEAELKTTYDSLKTAFKNEETMLEADFVAIPAAWKDMAAFTKLWAKPDATADLEAFCTQNAEEYLVNKWLSFETLAAKMPKGALQESAMAANKTYTIKQPTTHYYIRIRKMQKKGDTPDFEAARDRLKSVILQQRKGSLWDKAIENAYQTELKNGQIEIK
jgi:hypothetical protein